MLLSWRGGVTDLGEVAPATCPSCGQHVFMHLIRTQDAIALYFIAVAPYSVTDYLSCPNCKHGLQIGPEQRPAVDVMTAHTATYRRGVLRRDVYDTLAARFWERLGVAPSGKQVVHAPPVPPAPAVIPGTPAPSLTAQLDGLAKLHDDGVLTDEEFATAKQRVLEDRTKAEAPAVDGRARPVGRRSRPVDTRPWKRQRIREGVVATKTDFTEQEWAALERGLTG